VAELKRIAICLPDSLLKEFDDVVCNENVNRSELIRKAMRLYIKETKKMEFIDRMKKGYIEMGQINVTLAEIGLTADYETIINYESRLAECE
jgi:CopG family transcriptional regulator/antitoxin EndoAI